MRAGVAALALILVGLVSVGVARAQYVGGGSVSGGSSGGGGTMTAAEILTEILTVDTDDSTLNADTLDGKEGAAFLESGVCGSVAVCANVADGTADYTCTANTTCEYGGSGTGTTRFSSGNSTYGFWSSAHGGDPDFNLTVTSGNVAMLGVENSVANLSYSTNGITAGALLDTVATTTVFRAGDGVQTDGTITRPGFEVYGENTGRFVPQDALTIADPTDTASTPLGSSNTGAGTGCRMSAAGSAAWTPAETGAVTGMFWCCTNTGTNAITMTDVDAQYEGPGSVVGQWDTVCFEYVTDRFVERSFSNNEP